MGDPVGYLYLALGLVSLAHLWWHWETLPTTQRRGRLSFGLTLVYAGATYATRGAESTAAFALLGVLVLLTVYYGIQAWRRGESWWHENEFA